MIFLQGASMFTGDAASSDAILAFIGAAIVFFMILFAAIYVYSAFAYSAVARKAKYPSPAIAWIPLVGPALITSKTAKMHWWPILLLIAGEIMVLIGGVLILNISFILFAILLLLRGLFVTAFIVFSIIWLYKTYEVIGKPGWWAILMLILPVGLVMLGIAAWSKN